MFMPVATQASLKGLTPEQLEETGCKLCLNNTYHLGLKPGQAVLDTLGGAHKLQGWNYNILTDSGGWVASCTILPDLISFTRARCWLADSILFTTQKIPDGLAAQVGQGYGRRSAIP